MSPVGHARVKEVFLAVCALPPAEREAVLAKECVGDPGLRKEVESLLLHHQDASILAARPRDEDAEEPRIVQLRFGQGTRAKWNEEQRKFLHQRIRVWVLASHMVIALMMFRAVSYLHSWPRLPPTSKAGMLTGCIMLVGISIVTLTLRSPSFAWLRRLEVAILGSAALVISSWSYGWLSKGLSLAGLRSPALDEHFASVFWVISTHQTTHFQLGPALISFPVANYFCVLTCLYGMVLPNTLRRIVIVLMVLLLLLVATVLVAAWTNPALRPYVASNLAASCILFCIGNAIFAYVGLKFQALRRAVFDAKQVGQYRLMRLLGKGAMGEVYLAQHRFLRRPCAVKLIRAEQAGSKEAILRFEREVQAMAQLTHPNNVEVYDFGQTDDDSFFYAMEYLPGTTLDALVRSHGPLPAGRVVYLLGQICSALAEAHHKGLVHRDIKPSNIFVCERGGAHDVVKLLDFGLVHIRDKVPVPDAQGEPPLRTRSIEAETALPAAGLLSSRDLTRTGQILGTPAYMAPELIDEQRPDARSDIYSLGGVACFLLTGRPPFERETLAELYSAHVHAELPRLREQIPELPSDLESVLLRCLAKEPSARYQDAVELAAALATTRCSAEWSRAQAETWWQAHAAASRTEDRAEEGKTAEGGGVEPHATGARNG